MLFTRNFPICSYTETVFMRFTFMQNTLTVPNRPIPPNEKSTLYLVSIDINV